WGPEWDPLLANDTDGVLVQKMNETVDGQYQKYSVSTGDYIREHFFGPDPRLRALVEHLSDEQLTKLRRGGHSYRKLYAAYRAATDHQNAPVAILAKTVKGWTLGKGFEASNATHQLKKLDESQLRKFRDTLELPIPDAELGSAPYYHPGPNSPEVEYLLERRRALGGPMPRRTVRVKHLSVQDDQTFGDLLGGSKTNLEASTTMAFVRVLRKLLRDPVLGKYVVPITPDEARTFGMESLFREIGIYSARGQQYDPVDSHVFLNYHEAIDGQLLEEGITEAGSMASFTAAATGYATHGVPTIPFYIFYSMFGMQRTADLIWAVGDQRGRGFLLGATAGRTTLNGEGLQHEDGHSHLFSNAFPNLRGYDPAYAYELAVIIRDGMQRMFEKDEDIFYYITLYNENYLQPPLPEGTEDGILRGLYLVSPGPACRHRAQIFGSGSMLRCALSAQQVLAERWDVGVDVWSATSYQQLFRDARAVERHNRLHPTTTPHVPYVAQALEGHDGPVVAVSDWVSEVPSLIGRFIPRRFVPLGTNGYGRSDTRQALRQHFEVSASWIVATTLSALAQDGVLPPERVVEAMRELDLDADKPDPMTA
ncbi:MAG: pyruvate dehydrogenase (acetyl-transferring), homodimeric type, partial [Myxococcota bacterium]